MSSRSIWNDQKLYEDYRAFRHGVRRVAPRLLLVRGPHAPRETRDGGRKEPVGKGLEWWGALGSWPLWRGALFVTTFVELLWRVEMIINHGLVFATTRFRCFVFIVIMDVVDNTTTFVLPWPSFFIRSRFFFRTKHYIFVLFTAKLKLIGIGVDVIMVQNPWYWFLKYPPHEI